MKVKTPTTSPAPDNLSENTSNPPNETIITTAVTEQNITTLAETTEQSVTTINITKDHDIENTEAHNKQVTVDSVEEVGETQSVASPGSDEVIVVKNKVKTSHETTVPLVTTLSLVTSTLPTTTAAKTVIKTKTTSEMPQTAINTETTTTTTTPTKYPETRPIMQNTPGIHIALVANYTEASTELITDSGLSETSVNNGLKDMIQSAHIKGNSSFILRGIRGNGSFVLSRNKTSASLSLEVELYIPFLSATGGIVFIITCVTIVVKVRKSRGNIWNNVRLNMSMNTTVMELLPRMVPNWL